MASEPKLRSVSSQTEGERIVHPHEPEPPDERRAAGASILLGIALAITLLLLAWSRIQLGGQIAALTEEAGALRAAVAERDVALAERDRVIGAQRGRLAEVRSRIDQVQALLDQPLPAAD
jgi:hypothetical protein